MRIKYRKLARYAIAYAAFPIMPAKHPICNALAYRPTCELTLTLNFGYKNLNGCGLPLSCLVSGTSTIPLNKFGMPITTPEKVAFPPKYSAYLLEEEIRMK